MGLRFRQEGYTQINFITTSVIKFVPLFLEDRHWRIIIDNLNFYRNKYGFKLLGYVIMPEHVHFLLCLPSKSSISAIMRDIKKFSSSMILGQLEKERDISRLEIFGTAALPYRKQRHKVWMDRFDNVAIFTQPVLKIKLDYIHNNTVRRGLVREPAQWIYSSARNYYLGDHSVIKVDGDEVEF